MSEQGRSQPELFPDRSLLRRIDPSINMRRFYYMTIQPTLFGGVDLTCEWGRLGSPGKILHLPHADEGQAIDALKTISAKRKGRGYTE